MKNEKIKVYLQYPWIFPDSPYYKYLINNLSEGIEYINVKKQKGVIINKKIFWFSNFLKKVVRKGVRIFYPSMPNAHLSPKEDYDLIHCAHCLSKNKDKPWVADIEYRSQMWVSSVPARGSKKKVEKLLLDENCKKILPWTRAARDEIKNTFKNDGINKKMQIVYPGIPLPKLKKIKHKNINLFFVARYFHAKGGLHALKVMDILTKKYPNARGIIVSEVPNKTKEKYSKNKSLSFYPLMPQKELFEKVYFLGDIFIYPGYSDSFGFAIPEVMSIGIPVVSVDISARSELIANNKNGFLTNTNKGQFELVALSKNISSPESKRIIIDMVSKTSELIENKKLLASFSKNARDEISSGKFSLEKINKKLKKIYSEAMK